MVEYLPQIPLVLGGSFNPLHHGHLIVARAVAEAAGFAKVRLMVAGQPPHKPADPGLAAPGHRVEMCRVATSGDHRFEIDDRETKRPGPSYTIETARELRRQLPFAGQPVPWLIGADLLPGLMRWRDPEALLAGDVVRFIVMRRGGEAINWSSLPEAVRELQSNVIEAPRIDISATEIRRRVAAGRDIRYLVPEAIGAYIEQHGLYRDV